MPSEALVGTLNHAAKPRRRPLTHRVTQNAPMLLALVMLVVSIAQPWPTPNSCGADNSTMDYATLVPFILFCIF